MKKFLVILFISLIAFCDCSAQKYQPRETWPYVNDEFVDKTIEGIIAGARTGDIGDGKIFVYDVENVYKIRTGESGFDALQDTPMEDK